MSTPRHEAPRASPGRRLRRAFLGVAGAAALLAVLLLGTPPGRGFLRWFAAQVEVEEARGRIIDATTGAGIPGATVVVSSFNGPWTPSIMGEVSHGVATTDADGRFVVPYQRLGNTRLSARAPGYATIFMVRLREEDSDVELPTSPAAAGEVEHRKESGFDLADTTAVVHFDLGRDTVVEDAGGADLAVRIDPASPAQVIVRALDRGGLAIVPPPPPATHAIDALAARCLAPDSGYAATDTVRGNVSTNWYFMRSRDGSRYSRVKLRVYGRGPTPAEGYRVEIERWMNLAGGRNVCAVPVEGEHYEFAAAERTKR